MNERSRKALEAIREEFHRQVRDLSPAEFSEVLDEFAGDIEGHQEALQEEAADGPDGEVD